MLIWSILLLGVTCVWLSRHLVINRAKRENPPLRPSYTGPRHELPRVSVLIAGKDEERNIETAVRTMLMQDYPNFELIVINDRSSDRTPEILERLKTELQDSRFKVIHIEDLPEGWFGKNNAMAVGIKQAHGQLLCFGDADCRQTSPRTLSVAVQYMLDQQVDFLSVLPELETHSIWERIIQPVCGAVMVFWFHPKKVNDPNDSAAYANGAYMLMSRSCYDAIGGHDAVRTEVNEDMHMARLAKKHQQRLFVMQSEDLYTVRMYCGFREIWRGWSRIFYGCFGTFRRLRVSMLMLLGTNIFPYTSLLIAMGVLAAQGWQGADPAWRMVAGAAGACVLAQQSVIMRFYRLCRTPARWAPTFIIGAVVCVGMLINAMLKLNGRTTTNWRGTVYRGDQVVGSRA